MPIDDASATTTTMKRSSDKNPKLPTFLDEGASAPAADAVDTTATSIGAERSDAEDALLDGGDAAADPAPATRSMFADEGAATATAAADDGAEPAAPAAPAATDHVSRHERGIATIALGGVILFAG